MRRRGVGRSQRLNAADSEQQAERGVVEVLRAAAALESHGTASDCPRRAAHIAICLAGALLATLIVFLIAFAAFISFDSVGVRTTLFIVRSVMPTAPSSAASPEPLNTFDEMLRSAAHRFDDDLLLQGERFGVAYFAHRPSSTKYGPHQWLWDSGFHQLVNRHRGLYRSIADLYSQLASQDSATGFIPEVVNWLDDPHQQGVPRALFGYSDSRRTDLTQMPVIGLAAEGIDGTLERIALDARNASLDKYRAALRVRAAFLCNVLPRIHRYLEWWLHYRDPDGDGLVSIIHPWESGLDASPLYDDVHRYNRAQRAGRSPDLWTSWGDDGQSTRPMPQELYPEFVVLLYRYRHRARWDQSRILDPIAAQTSCTPPVGTAMDGSRSDAAWNVTESLPFKKSARRPHPPFSTSIVDGIFDVEDVGVNAILAASLAAVSRLYDALVDTLRELERSRREGPISVADRHLLPFWWDDSDAVHDGFTSADVPNHEIGLARGRWCCWPEDLDVRRTRAERIAVLERRAQRANRQAVALSRRIALKAWSPTHGHFVSFYHTYRYGGPQGVLCMDTHVLRRETVQSLMPLLLPELPEEVVLSLLSAVDDSNRFGARGPLQTIPTVARREADVFEARASALMWRGPAWPPTNWLITKGLERVATDTKQYSVSTRQYAARLHADLVDRWVAMHRRYGFYEYHDPNTGEGLGEPRLGMSFVLLDTLLHAFDDAMTSQPLLLSSQVRSWIQDNATTVQSLRRAVYGEATAPWTAVLYGENAGRSLQHIVSRPIPDARFRLAPVKAPLLYPLHPHEDGSVRHVPPHTPAQDLSDDDTLELLSDDDDPADNDWRDQPRIVFGCCLV